MQQALSHWWRDDGAGALGNHSQHVYLPCELGSGGGSFQCNPTCPNQPSPPALPPSAAPSPPYQPSSIRGKSIYFVLVDRFARSDGSNSTPCAGSAWCGGSLRGLLSRLDYIEGMGFDCVWITPVVGQFEGRNGLSGESYHGYVRRGTQTYGLRSTAAGPASAPQPCRRPVTSLE